MSYIPKIGDRIKAVENGEHIGTVIGLQFLSDGNLFGALMLFDSEETYGIHLDNVYLNYWKKQFNTFILDTNIDLYLGREVYWFRAKDCQLLEENKSIQKYVSSVMDGANCVKCGEFSMYANPNFECYACRTDKYRFSQLNVDDPIA